MAHEGGRNTTPILDCIEVAVSASPSRSNTDYSSDEYQATHIESDSEDSLDPRDTAIVESLDSGSRARARFQLSPDKSSRLEVRANTIPRVCHVHNL